MTKRKNLKKKGNTQSKLQKRVPFSSPKDAATKATSVFTIVRNALASPLLRLPLEIRHKIWTEVLGDRLIHLEYDYSRGTDADNKRDGYLSSRFSAYIKKYNRSAWSHIVCGNDCREDQSIEKVVYNRERGTEKVYSWRPHNGCNRDYRRMNPAVPLESHGYETMHLTVLRSSRQIYVEANQVLWSTNTFSFTRPIPFNCFMMTRNIHQKRLIRKIRLEMEWNRDFYVIGWIRSLPIGLVRSLTGLRTLRLQIVHNMQADAYQNAAKDPKFPEGTFRCDALQKLSVLPLSAAEVAVRASETMEIRSVPGQWTARDRKETAGRLRAMLLNPRGAEAFAEAQRKEEELRKELRGG
ncbi:MAG: hypothetical protein Q9218_004159 [Villophora microphyllina]